MSKGVRIEYVPMSTFAAQASAARENLDSTVATMTGSFSEIGDPANDSTLRSMLETAFGSLRTAHGEVDDDLSAFAGNLQIVATEFASLDVRLAVEPDLGGKN